MVACSGTYSEPGYRVELEWCVTAKAADAQRLGFQVKIVFLPQYDCHVYVQSLAD